MKIYLWVGIALLVVSAHASDNPFELKENFGKLDNDQAGMLDDLKKLGELKELAEAAALDEPIIKESVQNEVLSVEKKVNESQVSETLDAKIEEDSNPSEDTLNVMRAQALEKSKKEFLAKATVIEDQKKEIPKLNKEVEDNVESVKKKEAIQREVQAYERERLKKLSEKNEEAESAALEKLALAQKEARAKRLAKRAAQKKLEESDAKAENLVQELLKEDKKKIKKPKTKKPTIEKMKTDKTNIKRVGASKKEDMKTKFDDINVTREKLEAKLAADKAYEEAVKEMSQED